MKEVQVGRIYKHFKGHYYYVICVGFNSETQEEMVVYKHLDESEKICIRSKKMFLEEIPERPDNVTGQKHRFELVNDMDQEVMNHFLSK